MTFEGLESDTWEALPGASRLTMTQREAIESDEPLLCVVAGAGAGKTRVLTLRVARRVREGSIEPDRTLVTTFSRKAAEELRTRLYSLGVSGVKAGTFHRTALGLLREHRELRRRPLPQLLPDRRRLLAEVTTGDPRRTRALDGEIGWAKARLVPPEHYEAEARRHRRRSGMSAEQVADAYARYEAERTRRRLLDFDDLIVACADALAGDSEFADSIRWRTRHLFVDEMQDVNPAQFRLLTAMLADEPDLFVVGRPQPVGLRLQRRRPDPARPAARDPARAPRSSGSTRTTAARRRWWRWPPRCCARAARSARRRGGACRARPGSTGRCPRSCRTPATTTRRPGRRNRAKMSRTPGRPWSSIAVLTRTNAQLAVVQAAMDKARVPSLIAGADLGPASDLRGDGDRRGVDRTRTRSPPGRPGRPGPRGAHAPSTAPRACSGRRSSSSASATGSCPSPRPRRPPPSTRSGASSTWR